MSICSSPKLVLVCTIATLFGIVLLLPLVHQLPVLGAGSCLDLWIARLYDRYGSLGLWLAAADSETLKSTGWELFNPSRAHFDAQQPEGLFFEGWYYKLSSAASETFVVIPGVALAGPDSHAFVMLGDPGNPDPHQRSSYHRFPLSEVQASSAGVCERNGGLRHDCFSVSFGGNTFTESFLELSIAGVVQGRIHFKKVHPWPATMTFPTVMGWFAYLGLISQMQCSHGVVSLSHDLVGSFALGDSRTLNFKDGTGYTEKDWGSEFPKTWTWLQSGHFDGHPGASLMVSVAHVPLPSEKLRWVQFTGFLVGLWDPKEQKLYRFATYTGASIVKHKQYSATGVGKPDHMELLLQDSQYMLSVHASDRRDDAVTLWAPRYHASDSGMKLRMMPFVDEMLRATVNVTLTCRADGRIVFQAVGHHGGLELQREVDEAVDEGPDFVEPLSRASAEL